MDNLTSAVLATIASHEPTARKAQEIAERETRRNTDSDLVHATRIGEGIKVLIGTINPPRWIQRQVWDVCMGHVDWSEVGKYFDES